jgi:DNA invertase Pin-like site-specific DNA recombinase
MKNPKQIALVYARASSDPKDQRISVDRQMKLCTARAEQLWPDADVRVFRDDGVTAADPDVQRPGFDDFIAAVRSMRKGELVGVVVNEQSRLTRQPGQWDAIAIALTKSGVSAVETLRNGPISVADGSRLVGGILALVDADEVARTRARVQAAHRALFEEGRPAGRAPFGYRSTKDEKGRRAFEIDPKEGPVVKRVFAWALQGHAISVIAEKLNNASVPPRSAHWTFKDKRKVTQWTSSTVRMLLKTPTVAGLRGHTDRDGKLHTVPGTWDALIDIDQWQAVQRMLGQPATVVGANGESYRVRTKPAPQPRTYLLSGGRKRSGIEGQQGEAYGVLRCAKCDHPLVAQTQTRRNGRRIPAYACHPKTGPTACGGLSISPADEVEALVVEAIQARLAASPKLRRRLEAGQNAEAAKLRKERDAAKVRMLDASKLFGERTIDRDSFDAMHGAAKRDFDQAEAKLSAMTSDETLPSVVQVQEGWERLTLKQQRAVVDRLVERIVIAPGNGGVSGLDASRVGKPEWRN